MGATLSTNIQKLTKLDSSCYISFYIKHQTFDQSLFTSKVLITRNLFKHKILMNSFLYSLKRLGQKLVFDLNERNTVNTVEKRANVLLSHSIHNRQQPSPLHSCPCQATDGCLASASAQSLERGDSDATTFCNRLF